MRRYVSLFALLGLVGCGSDRGDEGELVKPGLGVQGVPGNGYAVTASRAVPVSGGTLLVTANHQAVAADPDRDRVFIVGLTDPNARNVREVALQPNDEPGRVVEDGNGRVHVAARRGGVVVSIDLGSASIVDRRAVCAAPRGIAHDSATGLLHVACQGGELVSLPAAGGEAVRTVQLNRDLRDVVVQGTQLVVSRLKTAQLLVVDAAGAVTGTVTPTESSGLFGEPGMNTSSVAWRTIALPDGRVGVVHQRGNASMVGTGPAGYGGGGNPCGGGAIVHGTVTRMRTVPDAQYPQPQQESLPAMPALVGPSDIAVSRNGVIAVVSIGNSWFSTTPPEQNMNMPVPAMPMMPRSPRIAIVTPEPPDPNQPQDPCGGFPAEEAEMSGEPVAVAFDGESIVVQSRQPAQIQVLGTTPGSTVTIPLSNDSRADTGLALFHMNSGLGLACASCHPEGMEDGRVWQFADFGARRTQNLGGGIMNTAPFHWGGDLADFPALIHEVFESRMGSARPNRQQMAAFSQWVDTVPAPTAAWTDASAVERGRAVFESPETSCSSCHAGAQFTTNQSHDVGTGGLFQVPSLIGVGSRPPFMHNGCAPTLRDRFGDGACSGGDQHGTTSQLNQAQIDDLVSYLESL